MKFELKNTLVAMLAILAIGCSERTIELNEFEHPEEAETALKKVSIPARYNNGNFYTPPSGLSTVNFTGTTSAQLNSFIRSKSASGGAIIKIRRSTYRWEDIKMRSNVHLQIEAGTVIKPQTNTTNRIFNFGAEGNTKVENVSLVGIGGKFIVDISSSAFTNKNMVVVRLGRVNNFKLQNFKIEDRRSFVASIAVAYIGGTTDQKPWAKNGVIENISQTKAHTGYGLVQCYSGKNILFKRLTCEGGVTLRLETDDRIMKDEIKNGAKEGGVKDMFGYNIRCESGITPLMLSPHFIDNGKVTVDSVLARGCAFAVRVEQGFVELFDADGTYRNKTKDEFKNFIENKFALPTGVSATTDVIYKRGGVNSIWAIRLTTAGINAHRNEYVRRQLGTLKAGKFKQSTINNVIVDYKPSGAKIKKDHLKYLPCSEWSKLKNPGTSLGMGNQFEYHGPSLAVSIDNTNGSLVGGNYIVRITGQHENLPNSHIKNIKHNTPQKCNNGLSSISMYNATF